MYMTELNDIAHFNVYKISEALENDEMINKLNEILSKSKEKLIVAKSNLEFVLSQSVPIIVVDGTIIY